MKRFLTFRRLTTAFLILFAVLVVGIVVLQQFWVDPGRRCEASGRWYDISTRVCAQPIYIPDITGRAPGESRAEASNRGNQELLELEAEAARQQQAIDAEVERQRAAIKSESAGK